jgi:endonuclease/exonuclease/phosphatase family metal-dependent hydrolase
MRFGRRLILALTLMVAAAGCDESAGESGLKVMTWNAYYGFDVGPLLSATDPAEIPVLAAQAFAQLQATKLPERAAAFADRVAAGRPHLVGLQEVALIRLQSPGDAVAGGAAPAEEVFLDSLQVLLDALQARGLDYRVAGKVQNVDVELPMVASVEPLAFADVRLTDFDVVLARGDVAVSRVAAAQYAARLPIDSLGLEVPRGYVALDAAWGRHAVRFVSTHLEDLPFEPIQLAQAAELAELLAPETKPVVLVGDFNSPAPTGATCEFLAEQGFQDAWLRNIRRDEGEGLTWGHDASLLNPEAAFTMRIDLVLVRPGPSVRLGLVAAEVWGDEPSEKTASGLWPSDHAGVVAWLELKPRTR